MSCGGAALFAARRAPPARSGFTLVELLIVVVVLAIVSLIALPMFKNGRTDAVASSLAASVTQVTMVIEMQHQKSEDGTWPSGIEPGWFNSRMLPKHPDQMAGMPAVEVVNRPGLKHPRNKILVSGSPGAYWYNTAEGLFRARVKSLPSATETLDFYNLVNQSELSSLGSGGGAVIDAGSRVGSL